MLPPLAVTTDCPTHAALVRGPVTVPIWISLTHLNFFMFHTFTMLSAPAESIMGSPHALPFIALSLKLRLVLSSLKWFTAPRCPGCDPTHSPDPFQIFLKTKGRNRLQDVIKFSPCLVVI